MTLKDFTIKDFTIRITNKTTKNVIDLPVIGINIQESTFNADTANIEVKTAGDETIFKDIKNDPLKYEIQLINRGLIIAASFRHVVKLVNYQDAYSFLFM